jgi:hypothetical protein
MKKLLVLLITFIFISCSKNSSPIVIQLYPQERFVQIYSVGSGGILYVVVEDTITKEIYSKYVGEVFNSSEFIIKH